MKRTDADLRFFLRGLRRELAAAPWWERRRIVRDLRVAMREELRRAEIDAVVERLGTPRAVAEEYLRSRRVRPVHVVAECIGNATWTALVVALPIATSSSLAGLLSTAPWVVAWSCCLVASVLYGLQAMRTGCAIRLRSAAFVSAVVGALALGSYWVLHGLTTGATVLSLLGILLLVPAPLAARRAYLDVAFLEAQPEAPPQDVRKLRRGLRRELRTLDAATRRLVLLEMEDHLDAIAADPHGIERLGSPADLTAGFREALPEFSRSHRVVLLGSLGVALLGLAVFGVQSTGIADGIRFSFLEPSTSAIAATFAGYVIALMALLLALRLATAPATRPDVTAPLSAFAVALLLLLPQGLGATFQSDVESDSGAQLKSLLSTSIVPISAIREVGETHYVWTRSFLDWDPAAGFIPREELMYARSDAEGRLSDRARLLEMIPAKRLGDIGRAFRAPSGIYVEALGDIVFWEVPGAEPALYEEFGWIVASDSRLEGTALRVGLLDIGSNQLLVRKYDASIDHKWPLEQFAVRLPTGWFSEKVALGPSAALAAVSTSEWDGTAVVQSFHAIVFDWGSGALWMNRLADEAPPVYAAGQTATGFWILWGKKVFTDFVPGDPEGRATLEETLVLTRLNVTGAPTESFALWTESGPYTTFLTWQPAVLVARQASTVVLSVVWSDYQGGYVFVNETLGGVFALRLDTEARPLFLTRAFPTSPGSRVAFREDAGELFLVQHQIASQGLPGSLPSWGLALAHISSTGDKLSMRSFEGDPSFSVNGNLVLLNASESEVRLFASGTEAVEGLFGWRRSVRFLAPTVTANLVTVDFDDRQLARSEIDRILVFRDPVAEILATVLATAGTAWLALLIFVRARVRWVLRRGRAPPTGR